jgi:glycosyltransferase involved in cell wall biosynthesis
MRRLNLYLLIEAAGLPEEAYTLDIKLHTKEESLSLKRMADVLLHPSRAEGFGMNVLETQMLGTHHGCLPTLSKYSFGQPSQRTWSMAGLSLFG